MYLRKSCAIHSMAVKGSETRCDHQCFTTAVFVFPCFLNTLYKHVCVSLASTPANFHCSGFCLNADPVPLNPFGVSPRQGTASCPRSHLRSHVHLAFLPVRRHVFVYAEEPWGQKRCNLRIGLRYEEKQDYYAWECVQGSWKGKPWIAEKSSEPFPSHVSCHAHAYVPPPSRSGTCSYHVSFGILISKST